jgi:hypothetical protein
MGEGSITAFVTIALYFTGNYTMKLDDIYSSGNYLKADDLTEGKDVTVTISQWEVQEIEKDSRHGGTYMAKQIVLHFAESDKLFGLNKTNGYHIADLLGEDDPSKWPGAVLTLYRTKVPFGNKMVDAVRVKQAFYPETATDSPF